VDGAGLLLVTQASLHADFDMAVCLLCWLLFHAVYLMMLSPSLHLALLFTCVMQVYAAETQSAGAGHVSGDAGQAASWRVMQVEAAEATPLCAAACATRC